MRIEEAIKASKASMDEFRHVAWRTSAMQAAPAALAFLLVGFLYVFLKGQMASAATVMEKLLIMVMTGTLGWAAGRKYGE